jgi:hypothetical protein
MITFRFLLGLHCTENYKHTHAYACAHTHTHTRTHTRVHIHKTPAALTPTLKTQTHILRHIFATDAPAKRHKRRDGLPQTAMAVELPCLNATCILVMVVFQSCGTGHALPESHVMVLPRAMRYIHGLDSKAV